MKQHLAHISIIVDDYDKAIEFYTNMLNFRLLEDTNLAVDKRWVLVGPEGENGVSLLLAKAKNDEEASRIGNQTGGRVFLFLHTDNFNRDYQNLVDNRIKIVREPVFENYGTVAVFEDLYGNLWDLIEPAKTDEYFYSTAVLNLKNPALIKKAINELRKLKEFTISEPGNIAFDIKQTITDPIKIIISEIFINEEAFNYHLNSVHFQKFFNLNLVELENGYRTKNIC
ncbi:VOC family protein [Pedobacter aquatilis]|uniref:VOC family protein n=1 Tax=Pedobacter aquatilis TaxID=351343 RepID=UPI0025B2DA85|nr:VOC family protein [Pedobacter aquatilis]MDN3587897.1 VOC family protein [Pedobacter aquatilis]